MSKAYQIYHTFQDGATGTGNGTALDVEGLSSVAVQITGTFVATVTLEATVDDSNWVAVRGYNPADGAVATAGTAAGVYQVSVGGLSQLRARVSAYTSGTIEAVGLGVIAPFEALPA